MKRIKKEFLVIITLVFCGQLLVRAQENSEYKLVVEGFDWGPGANKVIVQLNEEVDGVKASEYKVSVERKADGIKIEKSASKGERKVVYAYVSNEDGVVVSKGKHITLVLDVSPNDPLSSPIKYIVASGRGSNKWIDYQLSITHKPTGQIWNTESDRILPGVDKFDLKGTYKQDGIQLTYASYVPKIDSGKTPLLIWLHGGGEGGVDPSIPLIANKAANYASKEIQEIFGGANVLVPQSPTFWMQDSDGVYTRGKKNDIYNKALFGLIENYVAENSNIDANRIYVGGCSNGGYMSLKLLIEHPHYFAAAYISALAFLDEYVTNEQLQSIKNIPIWFVHSKDDKTTLPNETVVPLYNRLISTGASNVHFSYYDHVVDLSGFYGGSNHHFSGHWSWIYSHVNDADFDYDGQPVYVNSRPVKLMQWMAHQQK
ncbi:prolyl oligopeptidase family serine peptidase [Aurantibacter sp.]|uniref:prolyl oligopeptidase family serine peptidase n=1 Tax=Aurantibacter sp. TaxID=2807103 RepID=UPI003266CBED